MSLLDQTTELMEQTKQAETQQAEKRLEQYRAILQRRHNPHKDDARQLLALMDAMGLTQADVAADIDALDGIAKLRGEWIKPESLTVLQESERAALTTLKTAQEAWPVQERILLATLTNAGNRRAACADGISKQRHTLATLKAEHPRPDCRTV